jgi:uncharacterized protein YlzI (FlbEa/FlbD family)
MFVFVHLTGINVSGEPQGHVYVRLDCVESVYELRGKTLVQMMNGDRPHCVEESVDTVFARISEAAAKLRGLMR